MKKTMIKKHTALAAAGIMMLAVMPVAPAAAADTPSVLVLGDSISSGEGLSEGEYGYYNYIADCTGGTLTNLAKSGMMTADLIEVIDNASNRATIASADIICISIGGNDLMHAAKAYFETQANEGENLIDTAKRLVKEGDSSKIITELTRALRSPRNTAVDNYPIIAEKIRALNPDAQIVFQTTYNPFEMPPEELKASGYSEDTLKKYNSLMNYVSNNEKQLNEAMAKIEGVKVADVSAAFSGTGWLYDRILQKDVHPTPLGHVLIAATVMDQLTGIDAKSARMGQTVENVKYSVYAQIPADDKTCIAKYALDVKHLTGDFDNNGEVSVEDAQNVLRVYTAGVSGKPVADAVTALQFVTGDVNEDKDLSVDDAQYILIYYVRRVVSGQDVTWADILKK